MTKYLANTKGQSLEHHLVGVARYSVEVLKSLGLSDEKLKELLPCVYLAGLIHDIGKLDPAFQKYILSKKIQKQDAEKSETNAEELRIKEAGWHQVFHHEISWLVLANYRYPSMASSVFKPLDAIRYAVYWHHPKAEERNSVNEIKIALGSSYDFTQYSDFLLKLMENFTHPDFISKFQSNDENDLTTPPYFIQGKGGDFSNIDAQARNMIVLSCLMEADREVSSWEPKGLDLYIASEKLPFPMKVKGQSNWNLTLNKLPDTRSQAQLQGAEHLAKSQMSVGALDPGAGKTTLALLWKYFQKNNRALIVALPKRRQVTALYDTVVLDYERTFSTELSLSIQAAHTGQVQLSNNGEKVVLNSDINILVFDRFLSSFYKRGQFNEFVKMLNSDLVLDEYHEFMNTTKMLPSLLVIMKIRSWLVSGGKTLLLSGTPDPALTQLIFKGQDFELLPRTFFPEISLNKCDYLVSSKATPKKLAFTDCLFSFNRVSDAQSFFLQNRKENEIKIVHSKYTAQDLEVKISDVIKSCGKDSNQSVSAVTSTMLQSSYNISFKNAMLTLAHPNVIAQFLGRKNRFGTKPNGVVTFTYEEDLRVFSKSKFGFRVIVDEFWSHLNQVIGSGKNWTHREASTLLWDEFWTKARIDTQYKILIEMERDAENDLKKEYPRKMTITKNGHKSSSSIFRESGLNCSAKIVDDNNVAQGQLGINELISVSATWETDAPAEKQVTANQTEMAVLNDGEVFSLTKYNNKLFYIGKVAELPVFLSHKNPDTEKWMKNSFMGKVAYRVYHRELGLIDESLISEKHSYLSEIEPEKSPISE